MNRIKEIIGSITKSKYPIKIILIGTIALTILELVLLFPFEDIKTLIDEVEMSSSLAILGLICCFLSVISNAASTIRLIITEKESINVKKRLGSTMKYIKMTNDCEDKKTYYENLKRLQNLEVITKREYSTLCNLYDVIGKKTSEKEIVEILDEVDHVLDRIVDNEPQEYI